jgi:hypothetical protein
LQAKAWKSPNLSIAVKDPKTLILTKRYYKENPRRRKKKNGVIVLLQHIFSKVPEHSSIYIRISLKLH